MWFADQKKLSFRNPQPGCLRGDIGKCLAPCARHCTTDEYSRQTAAARALLDGRDVRVLAELEAAMRECAEQRDFEQAASLRDVWRSLTHLHECLQVLRDVRRNYHFVYPVSGRRMRTHWNIVAGAVVVAVVPQPRDPISARRCIRILEDVFAAPPLPTVGRRADDEQIRLVASWFRKRPDELDRVFSPDQAIAFCRRCT
jgi:excinuclease ABC subunit C